MIKHIIITSLILIGIVESSFADDYQQSPITNQTPRKAASFKEAVNNQFNIVGLWSSPKSPLPGDIEIHRLGRANIGNIKCEWESVSISDQYVRMFGDIGYKSAIDIKCGEKETINLFSYTSSSGNEKSLAYVSIYTQGKWKGFVFRKGSIESNKTKPIGDSW